MRLIKTIIFFALLAYSILFCIENFQRISLTVPFIAEIQSVPLFLVIIGCLICGVLIGGLISTANDLKHFFGKKSTVKENKHLKKKVDLYETENRINENIENNINE